MNRAFSLGLLLVLTASGPDALALVSQENPPADRVAELGGVVTFSGWSCPGDGGLHGAITMAVDGGPAEVIGSRLDRLDTASVCNNNGRNGYAAIRNLGIDGDGLHTVRFFEDGALFAEATYRVTTFGERFVREAGRTTVVRDFPRRGQTTTLQWTQGLQTFVPVSFCEGEDCPCAILENLACSETATGSIGAAATVCNFCAGPVAPTTLRIGCDGSSAQGSAGASLVGPGECREVPCPGCELFVPPGTCAAGQEAEVSLVLTDDQTLTGRTQCCRADRATCERDRECCSGTCLLSGSTGICRPATCGNGSLDPGESCDGSDVDGFSCEDLVGGESGCSGSVSCDDACGFDLSGCNCSCLGDLDCEVQIDCGSFVAGCTVFGACENGACVTDGAGTAAVCLGSDPEFAEPRCPTAP